MIPGPKAGETAGQSPRLTRPGAPAGRPPPRTGNLPLTSGSRSRNCGRGDRRRPSESESPPLPAGGTGGRGGPPPEGRRSPPKRRRRKILVTVLLVLLALLAIGFVIHQIYVRPPDIPTHENQEAGTDPGSLGVGRREDVYTFLLVGRDDGQGGGGNTDTMMAVGLLRRENGTVDVLSIYRDTMVDVPGEIPKINSVYNRQGH